MRRVRKRKPTMTERIERASDRLVGIVSPTLGAKRTIAREAARSSKLSSRRTRSARSGEPWMSITGSADAETLPDLPEERGLSRDLVRNDATAASFVQTLVDNVVGAGIRPQSRPDVRLLQADEGSLDRAREGSEAAWARWSLKAEVTGRHDLHSMLRLVVRQWAECGEIFLVRNMRRNDPTRAYFTAWDVVDPDRVSSPNDIDQLDTRGGKNQIRSGVELSSRGVPVAYHFRRGHPGDGEYETSKNYQWTRISAFDPAGRPNVLHFYEQLRPGQTRGIPVLTPVMDTLDHLSRFQEAALWRERVAACFAAFITRPELDVGVQFDDDGKGGKQRVLEMEPGQIEQLLPGEDIRFPNLGGLGGDFEKFVTHTMRQVGAANGLPLELIAKNFSKTNFSSARAALLEARRVFTRIQRMLISRVLQPMWELVFEEAYLRGDLGMLPGADNDLWPWSRAAWVPPGFGWVDPQKEIAASAQAIEIGISTLADEAAAQGRDWEEVLEQQAREKQRREELGLSQPAPRPMTPNDDEDEEDDEEDDEDSDA